MPTSAAAPDLLNDLPRYRVDQTYDWNYRHAPDLITVDVAPMPGQWSFCGRRVDSPLGMPAGPLLNGRWILYYAALGFDVLTYKTVRSVARECFPMPNIVPVDIPSLNGHETSVPMTDGPIASWAVSFGMPSMPVDVWRRDIEWTRSRLASNKLLSVSVVGSAQPQWSIEQLADDYACCAKWAVESGADVIEVNFSCPNVATCDGQLYQQPSHAALVAAVVKQAIKSTPLIIKIGHVTQPADAEQMALSLAPFASALAMTNTIAVPVTAPNGQRLFDGQRRGICGAATIDASVTQTKLFADIIREQGLSLTLIGVGGARSLSDVRRYLTAGAEAVHLATSAMLDPRVALTIRNDASRACL